MGNPGTNPSRGTGRLQEAGLLLVIFVLGTLLAIFGGSVEMPKIEIDENGEPRRVFTEDAEGNRQLVMERKNKFLRAENLTNLAKDASFIAIMAVGATFVIVAGQIDLSVGAIYALASVIGALVFHAFGPEGPNAASPGWIGVALGMLACTTTATACGLFNGGMVVALKVHPFIITLGTMAIYRGIAHVITQGQSISQFPESFRTLIRGDEGSQLSLVPLIVMVLVAVAGWICLARMAAGRRVYAVGGNEEASRFSGIAVGRVKLGVFIVAGFTAGISSLLALGYYGGASSGDGSGYELDVIAAAVVGGASLSGGRGTALGALLGALIIKMLDNGIIILEINSDYSRIIIGSAVILAVVFDQLNTWMARRRELRST
jgi:ribose/xylose/arabinose/galactoside ABC-type transport system permease subunit